MGTFARLTISAIAGGAGGVISQWFGDAPLWQSFTIGLLIGVFLFLWMLMNKVESTWKSAKESVPARRIANRILSKIDSIPINGTDHEWNACLLEIEASLRGMGSFRGTNLRYKVEILRQLLGKATDSQTKENVTRDFLTSLAQEVQLPLAARSGDIENSAAHLPSS